jgi:hypothetical protein
MSAGLPPIDPHESAELAPTGGQRLAAPAALFPLGSASADTRHVASRLLDLRPGLLIVVARG